MVLDAPAGRAADGRGNGTDAAAGAEASASLHGTGFAFDVTPGAEPDPTDPASPTPTIPTPPVSTAVAIATPTPSSLLPTVIQLVYPCMIPRGYLMVRFRDREVFRRTFDCEVGESLRFSETLALGTGDIEGTLKIWVIAATLKQKVNEYGTVDLVIPAGRTSTVSLSLTKDPSGASRLRIIPASADP